MVEVREGTVAGFFAYREAPTLLAEYAAESSIDGLPTPAPHEPTYLRLERSGSMRLLVATLDGALIGFLVLLVTLNPHYSAQLAVAESVFVAAEHRDTGAGWMLIDAAEEIAKSKAAAGLLLVAPIGSRFARALELDKASRETNRVFFRSLV